MKKFWKVIIGSLCLLILGGCLTGCSSKSLQIKLESGYDYCIDADIDEVFLVGNAEGKTLSDVCITVANRKKNLIINLDNVNFYAEQDRPAISCENTTFMLTIRFQGKCEIVGGKGSDGENGTDGTMPQPLDWDGDDGLQGQAALSCGKVIFEAVDTSSQLTLRGGRGGNGGDACCHDTALLGIVARPNGGNGASGGPALICKNSTLNYDNVNFIAGSYGYGGKAGWCGVLYIPVYGRAGTNGKDAKAVICN